MNRKVYLLFCILLLGWIYTSFFVFPSYPVEFQTDEISYYQHGRSIAEGNWFRETAGSHPEISRPPGYLVFVGLVFSIFPDAYEQSAIYVIQLLMFFAVLWLWIKHFIPDILRALSIDERHTAKAQVAFLFSCGLFPVFWAYMRLIFSETLALFACNLALFFWWRSQRSSSLWILLGAGLASAALSLTKPVFMYMPLFLGVMAVLFQREQRWLAMKRAAVIVVIYFCALFPWGLRNYQLGERFTITLVGRGAFLYFGSVDTLDDEGRRLTYDISGSSLTPTKEAIAADNRLFEMAQANIKKDPIGWVAKRFSSFRQLWFTSNIAAIGYHAGSEQKFDPQRIQRIKYAMFALMGALWLVIFYGAFALKRWRELYLFWGVALYFSFFNSLGWAGGRYTVPLLPVLFFYFSVGVALLSHKLKKQEAPAA